jgi:hypothetical protein
MAQPKESKSNTHFKLSLLKSGFRLGACAFLFYYDLVGASIMLGIAEIIGILEEL